MLLITQAVVDALLWKIFEGRMSHCQQTWSILVLIRIKELSKASLPLRDRGNCTNANFADNFAALAEICDLRSPNASCRNLLSSMSFLITLFSRIFYFFSYTVEWIISCNIAWKLSFTRHLRLLRCPLHVCCARVSTYTVHVVCVCDVLQDSTTRWTAQRSWQNF